MNLQDRFRASVSINQYEDELFLTYHENTKLCPETSKDFFYRLNSYKYNPIALKYSANYYKVYSNSKKVKLEKYSSNDLDMQLGDILKARRSRRNYSNEPTNIKSLGKFLYFSYGINGSYPVTNEQNSPIQYLRFTPSAGALYPLEIYVVVNSVTDIEKGLYHYNILENCLEELKNGDFSNEVAYYGTEQEMLSKAGFVVIITAVFRRATFKYGERGYRFIHLDAGHLAQSMYLIGEALGLGVCAVGASYDRALEKFIGIDGIEESFIYMLCAGEKLS